MARYIDADAFVKSMQKAIDDEWNKNERRDDLWQREGCLPRP